MHVPSGSTLQAIWQVLLPWLSTYLDGVDVTLRAELSDVCTSIDAYHIAQMVDKLTTDRFQQHMKEFAAALAVGDPNAELWWVYMTMVSILLCFTRVQRDGSWDLHLYAFKRMMTFFFMLTTPDGVLCTWLRYRFSHQKNKANIFASLYEVVQPSNGNGNLPMTSKSVSKWTGTFYKGS